MSTPPLKESVDIWSKVTQAVDPFLDTPTTAKLQTELLRDGQVVGQTLGSALRRNTYHYWYHTGENQAIRQILGQTNLPEYVGDIEIKARYKPE